MDCSDCRELLSARLDGEVAAAEIGLVDAHSQSCTSCREWAAEVGYIADVTAAARAAADEAFPRDLAGRILDRLPPPRRPRPIGRRLLRLALCMTGIGQLALGILSIAVARNAGSSHHGLHTGADPAHLLRESAAWSTALGIAFIWVAVRGGRAGSALIPLLTAFVLFLLGVAAIDLYAGDAQALWEASHLLPLLGLILIILVSRRRPSSPAVQAARPRAADRAGERRRNASRRHAA
jgi:predicted anti-sigma-YlaC factor YlaD